MIVRPIIVNVSEVVNGFPAICAAEEAYFSMERSESLGRVSESLRNPRIPKSDSPNPSHSGTSTVA